MNIIIIIDLIGVEWEYMSPQYIAIHNKKNILLIWGRERGRAGKTMRC